MDVGGNHVLITGAASGLGLATATALAKRGATVVAFDLPGADWNAVPRMGGCLIPARGDVTDEDSVAAAVDLANSEQDLAAVVNCAGIGSARKVVSSKGVFPLDGFRKVVDVNLVGTFNVVRLAAAAITGNPMIGEERGVIVNTASVAAFEGQVGQAAYAAAKAGIVGMTLPLARELAVIHIRVMTIAPGLFDTPLLGRLSAEARRSLGGQSPHPSRLGQPSEYADLVCAVIANPMLNGETVRLDGALRMAPR